MSAPRTRAQARGAMGVENAQKHTYEIWDYGYIVDTSGTGLTYEQYEESVLPGTAMPRHVWESLPDPPSIEHHEEQQRIKSLRKQRQHRKKVGGFIIKHEYAPVIRQVYADPYIKGGIAGPHYHNPASKSWM